MSLMGLCAIKPLINQLAKRLKLYKLLYKVTEFKYTFYINFIQRYRFLLFDDVKNGIMRYSEVLFER